MASKFVQITDVERALGYLETGTLCWKSHYGKIHPLLPRSPDKVSSEIRMEMQNGLYGILVEEDDNPTTDDTSEEQ